MGIISSIFGERPSAPQTGGFTVGAEIPKELAPYYKDILGKSQALYNESVSRGYEPYTGPSLAEFTPEQQQAFTGIAGLQGQQAPVYQEAMGMTRDAAAPITTEQIEEYMNPYQQAVVDIEKREAQKQYESQVVPQLAAKAAMAQPFGGSRQAILEGMAADTQQRLLGDIQAKGSAQAYQDAISRLDADRLAKGQAGTQLANLATNQYTGSASELAGLQLVGEDKQKQTQTALDEAFKQYLEEQQYPYDTMGKYQSMVIGAPLGTTQYSKPQAAVMGPSLGQQLIGGLGGLGNIYGSFTGRTIGGQPYQQAGVAPGQTGGGIGTLIKRATSGPANNNDNKTFETNFGLDSPDAYINYLKNLAGPYSERFKKAEELTQEKTKLMEKDLKRDRSYLEADRANQQFNREQAAFTAMAKLGTDQDVTDAPGGGVGQILTMLGKAGPEIGASEKERRANIRQQDRDISKLEIQYKDAMAKGDLELANTYMAQLQALSAEYAKYMTAKAESLDALGLNKITPESIGDVIKKVGAQTSPQFALLLKQGALIENLNPDIPNPDRGGKTGEWTQNEILAWAQDNALQKLQLDAAAGKTFANTQIAFDNMVTRNIISLFTKDAKVADVSKGAEKTIDDNVVDSSEVIDSTKGNAKDTILSF